MKRLLVAISLPVYAVVFASCETSLKSAPPVTAAFLRANRPEKPETLEAGRKVFLNRCIACHALPDMAEHDAAKIPKIVGWMSGRACLTPDQHDALVRYLLAVKSQL